MVFCSIERLMSGI